MKLTITLLLLAGAALAEDRPSAKEPQCDEHGCRMSDAMIAQTPALKLAPSCDVGQIMKQKPDMTFGCAAIEAHLTDAQLRDYYRYLGELQAFQRQAKDAQDKLDKIIADMGATCKNGIVVDAAKGLACAKAPEKPAEKK